MSKELENKKFLEKLEKMDVILEAIIETVENIEVKEDGSLYVKFKSHFIIESEGNQIFYTNNGGMYER